MFCGDDVTTNAVLGKDLSCTGDGIIVHAAGIKVDLNGHMLMGDGGADDFGVDNSGGFDKVAVKNGVVRNFVLASLRTVPRTNSRSRTWSPPATQPAASTSLEIWPPSRRRPPRPTTAAASKSRATKPL